MVFYAQQKVFQGHVRNMWKKKYYFVPKALEFSLRLSARHFRELVNEAELQGIPADAYIFFPHLVALELNKRESCFSAYKGC
jgi:hypothetical protein